MAAWFPGCSSTRAGRVCGILPDVGVPDSPSNEISASLFSAVRSGDTPLVNTLLSRGAEINAVDRAGWTPLHHASALGYVPIARLLLKLHADPTVVALNGEKAVNLAKTEDMRDLLQSCDPALGWAYRDGSSAWTEVPLSKAQQNAQASASAAAASAAAATAAAKVSPPPPPPPAPPAEVEAVDEAAAARILAVKLSQAAYFGNASEVRALLAAGADATTTDGCGMTALHWVASRGTGETARVLCAAGALVNCRSNDGWTPLHLAALAGRADVVKVLLELGAEATAVNNQGRTPLQVSESQSVRDLLGLSDPSAAAPAPPPLPAAPAPAPPLRQAHAPASFLTAAALGEKALSDEMERLRLKKSAAAAAEAAGKAALPPRAASSGSLGDSAAAAYRAAADFAGLQ